MKLSKIVLILASCALFLDGTLVMAASDITTAGLFQSFTNLATDIFKTTIELILYPIRTILGTVVDGFSK